MIGYLKWFVVPAVAGVFVSAPTWVSAQEQPETTAEDQALVDMFFKDKITAVRRSRDTADDVELISEILGRAQEVPDSPAVQWLMYETAVDLGMTSEVYAAAIDAAMQMLQAFPESDAVSDESLLVLMEQAYRSARRSDRPEVAEPYLALLQTVAETTEAGGDVDRAGRLYRTGVSVARAVRSEQEEVFEEHVRRLNEIEQLNSRIRMLTSALEANPRNGAAARELTMLLVLERRDLAAASEFVELTRDDDLIDAVTMGADGPSNAGAVEALRVGDWYYALSQEEEGHAGYLLGESLAFYDRFLEVYDRDDALRSRASTLRLLVTSRLEEIAQTEDEAEHGRWIDCIGLVDRDQHRIEGAVAIRDGMLTVDEGGFVLPRTPTGDYDLRFSVQYNEGPDGIVIHLPLGDGGDAGTYQLSRIQHSVSGLYTQVRLTDKKFMLSPGQQLEFAIQVRLLQGHRARISSLVQGIVMFDWTGNLNDLEVGRNGEPRDEFGPVIGFWAGGEYVFDSIELRELDD